MKMIIQLYHTSETKTNLVIKYFCMLVLKLVQVHKREFSIS